MIVRGGLVLLINFVFFIISFNRIRDMEGIRMYECGFNSSSVARAKFSYRFFLIAILFLIFDVEVALILPVPFLEGGYFFLFLFFLLVLVVGALYENYCGSLEWV